MSPVSTTTLTWGTSRCCRQGATGAQIGNAHTRHTHTTRPTHLPASWRSTDHLHTDRSNRPDLRALTPRTPPKPTLVASFLGYSNTFKLNWIFLWSIPVLVELASTVTAGQARWQRTGACRQPTHQFPHQLSHQRPSLVRHIRPGPWLARSAKRQRANPQPAPGPWLVA